MGWLRELWQQVRGVRAPLARIIPTWMSARPLPPPAAIRRLLDEGYRKQALVYACINELATSVAEPVIRVGRMGLDGELVEDPNHPLKRLLDHPNPETSTYELFETAILHLQGAGNFYLHKVKNARGATVQLWTLRPDRVKVKPAPDGMVDAYEYSFDGMLRQLAPAADVIQCKLPDPLDDYYGLSPIAALARFGDLDAQAADFMRAYFSNAGAPSGLLKFKTTVNKDERLRIQSLWREQHGGGFDTWHNVSVIDANVDYQALGGAPERLRLNFIFDATETRICMAFGVPPIVVGAAIGLARSTFANYREARRSMWDETLAPLYRRIGDVLSRGFADEYGPDVRVWFDLSTISAMQEDSEVRRRFGLDAWNAGLMKKNEARAWAGLDEDPEGDEYKAEPAPAGAPAFGAAGDPFASLFRSERVERRDELVAVVRDLREALQVALEQPAAPPIHLDVRTDAGEGLERMADGLRRVAEELARREVPTVIVQPAAPAPAGARVLEVQRGPRGLVERATIRPAVPVEAQP